MSKYITTHQYSLKCTYLTGNKISKIVVNYNCDHEDMKLAIDDTMRMYQNRGDSFTIKSIKQVR